mmetsp:Transcript_13010/g.28923  ORF Transcript_13010/g.28923 Transcript_13010/m.28923 type:complete len:276 (+) Transcript_13010:1941-2768(+)
MALADKTLSVLVASLPSSQHASFHPVLVGLLLEGDSQFPRFPQSPLTGLVVPSEWRQPNTQVDTAVGSSLHQGLEALGEVGVFVPEPMVGVVPTIIEKDGVQAAPPLRELSVDRQHGLCRILRMVGLARANVIPAVVVQNRPYRGGPLAIQVGKKTSPQLLRRSHPKHQGDFHARTNIEASWLPEGAIDTTRATLSMKGHHPICRIVRGAFKMKPQSVLELLLLLLLLLLPSAPASCSRLHLELNRGVALPRGRGNSPLVSQGNKDLGLPHRGPR